MVPGQGSKTGRYRDDGAWTREWWGWRELDLPGLFWREK